MTDRAGFNCPQCKARLSVKCQSSGLDKICPGCGQTIRVPVWFENLSLLNLDDGIGVSERLKPAIDVRVKTGH